MEPELDVITFRQDNLPVTAFAAFADMRKLEQLCDLTVRVQDHSFTAHRVIVAGVIPYFRTMFTSGEIKTGNEEIGVDDLDPRALESLIDFAYSGEVSITAVSVRSLVMAAQFLQLNQVRDACVEFMTERLRVDDVIQVRTLGQSLSNLNLIANCDLYIRKNFEEFSKCDDFRSLPYFCIKEIISQDDLNVASEEIVLEAVMDWVKVSPSDRHAVLPDLLSEVRMIYLPVDCLKSLVASQELVRTSIPCRDLIDEVKNFHLSKGKAVFPTLNTVPRKISMGQGVPAQKCNSTVNKDIYAVCYKVGTVFIYYCNFDHNRWDVVASKSLRDGLSFAAAVNEKIYIFLTRTILTFHPQANEWDLLESTHGIIKAASVVSHENVIYCFDQSCGGSVKICCFDTQLNRWLPNKSMKTYRIDSAVTSLGDSIYITGGVFVHPDQGWKVANTVEKYNPSTNQWSEVSPMRTARHWHGCTTLRGKIYVCGGAVCLFQGLTDKAEVYDPLADQWCFIPPMLTQTARFSLVSSNSKIYAIERVYSARSPTVIEMYDPETKVWNRSSGVPLQQSCIVVSACSL